MWTMVLAAAAAQVSPETSSTGAFHDELARAKSLLEAGQAPQALAVLDDLAARLRSGETPPETLAMEAAVYRGDLQFGNGDVDGARDSFRSVLLDDPEYTISPYHHGEDVRAFFALVREQVRKEIAARPLPPSPKPIVPPPPPPPRRRLPMWGYAPFGLPQFRQGRTGAGVAYAVAQGAFGAVSLGSYVQLVVVNRAPGSPPPDRSIDSLRRQIQTTRYAVQLPATAAFYATWVLSTLDGAGTWKQSQRGAQVQWLIHPSGLIIQGTF